MSEKKKELSEDELKKAAGGGRGKTSSPGDSDHDDAMDEGPEARNIIRGGQPGKSQPGEQSHGDADRGGEPN